MNDRRRHAALYRWSAFNAFVVLMMAPQWGAAQSQGSSAPPLEEIVVTAQKREQRLQDVPFSVSALSAEQIAASGITRLDDVARYTPGLFFETIGIGRPQAFIRGIGSAAFDAGSDPSVALFVDEIYIARFTGVTFDLFDLERIEVLKGPQGTLFGRNAAGGALHIVTRKPSEEFSAQFAADIGNYDSVLLRGGISGPLSRDSLLYRLSFATKESEGYIRNTATGERHQDDGSHGLRGQLAYTGSDGFDAIFTLEYGRDDIGMLAEQNVTDNVLFRPPGDLAGQSHDLSLDQQYNTDGFQERTSTMLAAHLNWETTPGTLTSISAYRNNEFEELHDLDSTLFDTLDRYALEDGETFSQEFRLASSADAAFNWVAGLYYLHESTFRDEQWTIGSDTAFALFMNGGQRFNLQDVMDVTTDSYAAFGQGTYALTPAWNLTVGGRYSRDEKSADRLLNNNGIGAQCTPATPCGPFPVNVLLPASFTTSFGRSWNSFDPQVTVDYRAADDVMLYATYREGFKSGGFQPSIPANAERASFIFGPEDVRSYEIGLKSELADRRLRLNAALFHNRYEDLQFVTGTGVGAGGAPIVVTDNAAHATSQGVEIELLLRSSENLQLSAGYSYVDATIDEYVDDAGNDQSGKQVIRTPKHQASTVGEYTVALGGDSRLVLRGEWSYRSRVYFDPGNTLETSQEGFSQFSARIAYETGGAWSFALWGRNLGDELYCQNTITLSASTVGVCHTGPPRTYGLSFQYSYQ
jgi:iron complex outermembrane recepter protein